MNEPDRGGRDAGRLASHSSGSGSGPGVLSGPDNFAGPLILRATSGRVSRAVGSFFFAAFWNGIVSVFVAHVIHSALRGGFEWFMALFLIPFVLIGIGMIIFFIHSFLGIFAPRVVVTLNTRDIHLGDPVDLEWEFSGRVHVIETLRIHLEGCEEASYRRGTSTSTDRHIFAKVPVFTATEVSEIRSGRARLHIPADSVPTFAARNNKIVWNLRVEGVIRKFPDVADIFPITILPLRLAVSS